MHTENVFFVILIIAIIMFAVFVCGDLHATSRIRDEAIKAKVAEYQVNKETGKTKFIFLTPAEKDVK